MMLRVFILALVVLTLSGCDLLDNVRLHNQVIGLQNTIKELEEINKSLEASLSETQTRIQLYDTYIAYAYFCDYGVRICDDVDIAAGRQIIAAGHDNLTYIERLLLSAGKSLMYAFYLITVFTLGVAMHIYFNYPDQVRLQAMKEVEANHAHQVETARLEHERLVAARIAEQDRYHHLQHENSMLIQENEYHQQVISDQITEMERLTRMAEALKSL